MGRRNRFYAYVTARARGIASSWAECEAIVSGRHARYKGFPDRASAEAWLAAGAPYEADPRKPPRFYAHRTEADEGISTSWADCERHVKGRRARYRSFPDRASAEAWLTAGAPYEDRDIEKREALSRYDPESVFFDSGTGPGRGTEIRVTDRDGIPLVHLAPYSAEGRLQPDGNLLLGRSRTNNYGELLSCLLAIEAASALGWKHVHGDSALVLDYWSLGRVSSRVRERDPDLARLAGRAREARARFESAGGRLGRVPGRFNPADLGFHRER